MLNHTARNAACRQAGRDEAVEASGGGLSPREGWYGSALLVVLIFAAFHPILQNDFVTWDDGLLITENPIIQEFSIRSLHKAFTSYDPELYIPLTLLSYQIDHLFWGLNPAGFHLTNLVLHTLNAVLVFWLMTLLGIPSPLGGGLGRGGQRNSSTPSPCHSLPAGRQVPWGEGTGGLPFVAFAVATIWAVHPLNTEAVAWASARKDLLSGFFFLLSLCTYLRWRERVTPSGDEGRHNFSLVSWFVSAHHDKWYWFSIVAFLFGLLAKVSIAPLPLVLLLLEWCKTCRTSRLAGCHGEVLQSEAGEPRIRTPCSHLSVTIWHLLPYFLLSIIFGIIALFGKTGNTELFSEKILIGAKATMFYLEKLLWPTGLSVLYPYTQSITWTNPDLLLPLIVVLSLSAVAFSLRKKAPMVCFGWAFFLLMLLPSFTNFAKGHDELRDVYFASDRYAYLPSIGIFFLAGYWLSAIGYRLFCNSSIVSTGLVYIIILPLSILSFLSYKQSLVWRNTETLFRNVAEQHPTSHIAWNNLGSLALERLDIKTAMKDYERSLTIRPNAAAFFNLGQIAMKKGLVREAMELYRRAIASRPNDTDSLLNLGVLHLRNGNAVAAADFFRRAIAFDDRLAIAHFNLGLALEAQKDHDGARSAYTRALELDPNDRETREKLAL